MKLLFTPRSIPPGSCSARCADGEGPLALTAQLDTQAPAVAVLVIFRFAWMYGFSRMASPEHIGDVAGRHTAGRAAMMRRVSCSRKLRPAAKRSRPELPVLASSASRCAEGTSKPTSSPRGRRFRLLAGRSPELLLQPRLFCFGAAKRSLFFWYCQGPPAVRPGPQSRSR